MFSKAIKYGIMAAVPLATLYLLGQFQAGKSIKAKILG